MKLRILLFTIVCICFFTNAKAGIPIPIPYSNGEDIVKVMDLPREDQFAIESNGMLYHADLGIMHDQFSLFWIPLVNYGTEKYVLFTDKKIGEYDMIYADLSSSDIEYLQNTFGGIPTKPKLPFWHAWGGKLLVFGLIVVLFIIWILSKSEESSEKDEKA